MVANCVLRSHMHVAVGAGCTFVINEGGSLFSWGRNGFSELGRHGTGAFVPSMSHSVTPTQIIAFGSTVKTVTAKGSRAACIMEDGSVWMWGKSNITPEPRTNKPPRRIAMQEFGGERPVQIACSSRRNYVLTEQGSVFSTVSVDGIADGVAVEQFSQPMLENGDFFGGIPVAMIASGKYHVLAIGKVHGVWSWGANFFGSLGGGLLQGQEQHHPFALPVLQNHRCTFVAAGSYHSIVVSEGTTHGKRHEGGVFAWGNARHGQLGLERRKMLQQETPCLIPAEFFEHEKIATVVCTNTCTVTLSVTGKMWMFGQLFVMSTEAIGTTTSAEEMVVAEINYADTHSWEWEDTDNDVLDGDNGVDEHNPFMYHIPRKASLIPFAGSKISSIAAGSTHVCICTQNGLLYTWNGFRPALFRPISQPFPDIALEGKTVQQPYFGG